jgi:hypothetical protein
MKIDVRVTPRVLKRLAVVRLDTMMAVADIAWADDEEGRYGTWKRSGHRNEIEMDAAGEPVIIEHVTGRNSIRIVKA